MLPDMDKAVPVPPSRSRSGQVKFALLIVVFLALSSGIAIFRPFGTSFEAPAPRVEPALPRSTSTDVRDLMPVSPQRALELNAAMPYSNVQNPPAAAFHFPAKASVDYERALRCLTYAIYYEAASEGDAGQRAVAQIVLNRVRHPAFPTTICGVVFEGSLRSTGCQFTFTCDGSVSRVPSQAGLRRAERIASAALDGYVYAPVGLATHYHTDRVLPYWAPSLLKSAAVGAHIFYRWGNGWSRPAIFRRRYAGSEPTPDIWMSKAITIDPGQPTDAAPQTDVEGEPKAASNLYVDQQTSQLLADEKAGALIMGGKPSAEGRSESDAIVQRDGHCRNERSSDASLSEAARAKPVQARVGEPC